MKQPAIHPLFFAAHPMLFFFAHNLGEVLPGDILPKLLKSLAAAAAALLVLGFVRRDWHKAALLVSTSCVLFAAVGHARDSFGGLAFAASVIAAVACLGALGRACWRSRRSFARTTPVLNAAGFLLLVFPTYDITRYEMSLRRNNAVAVPSPAGARVASSAEPAPVKPDIYVILLDAYARQDVLREVYDFDNQPFVDFLQDRGFYVAGDAVANYSQTHYAVAALLQMTYMDGLLPRYRNLANRDKPFFGMVEDGLALKLLRQRGYRIIALQSGFVATELKSADVYLESSYRMHAPPNPDDWRSFTLHVLDNLASVATSYAGPKLVFAHVIVPHPPFVFGPDGEHTTYKLYHNRDGNLIIRPGGITRAEYRAFYVDQLTFVNNRMRQILDEILSTSQNPPVVLLFGDHGPRSELEWDNAEKTNLWECMSILNAYHLERGRELLYPGISPVNSMRVVLSAYFGLDLPLLPDRSFFTLDRKEHTFVDVTRAARKHVGRRL